MRTGLVTCYGSLLHLGHAASHGCIRLANWDIVRLAQRVKPGVPVSIH